jgi:osmotically-inducible protein OsmY
MSNDSSLKQAVLDELKWEPSVNAAHIGVTVHAGIVTLSGHVQGFAEKSAAEKAAARVKAVKAVAEEIEVRLPSEIKRDDEEIATAAVDHLAWDSSIPTDAIKVKVANGLITLTGEVEWHYQQEAAAKDVGGLIGVVGVYNQVTIKPKPNATNIRDDILVALHRSWFDPKTITVTAQGGNVQLAGTVREWSEREIAGSTAWAAPGTTSVENNIKVD